ncbi:hypothetical protein J921_2972 [Acinetobacter baumannii 25493_8]|uniref:Uncharacterized protein n=3 Tax=Acinetobacter baumannii TaxID=470 RepID=A0ABC9UYN8_ACIBA|nr:hypothetical protein BJAB0715_03084 [Acinetobacter baumannii BJAB0715]AGQ11473.1 hypothetical protein BJAB0868_02924 [Acinetobacter baumannii BJAB0868]AGQ15408.1 hypothetical protein BJAB07104_03040 [Acinetobacter baumannii BJAB07104]AIY36143.1 hypothetical protein ABLAC_07880 [Acinetobacter baumannii LAC-4]ALJ86811.1 hypothetical protein AN415_00892 [Acinetobacter baumannii]EJG11197.1 hypothetical protein ACIN3137_A1898 [Acinetobacter baumannii OIFC137]EJG19600.1 hypothetical protein ACIN
MNHNALNGIITHLILDKKPSNFLQIFLEKLTLKLTFLK